MTAIRAANGRMQRYHPDPAAPHVVLQEDDRPAMKFSDPVDAFLAAYAAGADCILWGVRMAYSEHSR